jgi:hypothetical protein
VKIKVTKIKFVDTVRRKNEALKHEIFMNHKLRMKIVHALRKKLSELVGIEFRDQPEITEDPNSIHSFHFSPKSFNLHANEYSGQRIGLYLEFENEMQSENDMTLNYGFEIYNNYFAGKNLKKQVQANPIFRQWLSKQWFRRLQYSNEGSIKNRNENHGMYFSFSLDFMFFASGLGKVYELDLTTLKGWDTVFQHYPLAPPKQSSKMLENRLQLLHLNKTFSFSKKDFDESISIVARFLVRKYMPFFDACMDRSSTSVLNLRSQVKE